MLSKLTKIGRYIKYDGKPPMSDDEIIELTMIEHEREQAEQQAKLQKEREREALIALAKHQKEQRKIQEQTALDNEEARLDGEIDYYDQMTIPCPKCGDDIMRKESQCTALACGKRQSAHVRAWQYSDVFDAYTYGSYSRPPYWRMDTKSVME